MEHLVKPEDSTNQASKFLNKSLDPNIPDNYKFFPIGYIKSIFKNKNGTPRQSGICNEMAAKLEIDSKLFNNPDHTIDGLEHFSHVWLLFVFHKNNNRYTKAKVRPPRLNGKSQGVFATRSPYRLNPIGLTLAQIVKIEGHVIYLSGVDIIDGTPILDIKPYIEEYDNPKMHGSFLTLPGQDLIKVHSEFDDSAPSAKSEDEGKICEHQNFEVKEAFWIKNADTSLHLNVRFTPTAENQLLNLLRFQNHENNENHGNNGKFLNKIETFKESVYQILSADPRSSYRRNKCQDRLYFLTVDLVKLTCWFDEDDNTVEVLKVNEELENINNL